MKFQLSKLAYGIGNYFSPPQRAKRGFTRSLSAVMQKLGTSDLPKMNVPIDNILRDHLGPVRAASQALVTNNNYAKAFIRMVEHNVIGAQSITMKSCARDANGEIDKMAKRIIEAAWLQFVKPMNCDVTGQSSLHEILLQIVRNLPRDGEVFVRIVKFYKDSIHRVALQIIRPEWINHKDWDQRKNVKAGIEFNEWGRPTGYRVKEQPGEFTHKDTTGSPYSVVPAGEMIHIFKKDFPSQVRGMPWMHTAIIELHQLGQAQEAAVMAFRIGASSMGFITKPNGVPASMDEGTDSQGNQATTVSPGTIAVLDVGESFEQFKPENPSANYGPFIKATLRGIASGLGVSYNGLASDLEGVNYSSLRAGLNEEREYWKALQRFICEQFLDRLFPVWLDMAMLSGGLAPLPSAKLEKFAAVEWSARGWGYVDPYKDVQAAVLAIENKLETRTNHLAKQGRDFEDILEQIAAEEKLAKSYGVSLAAVDKAMFPPPAKVKGKAPEKEEEEEEEEVEV